MKSSKKGPPKIKYGERSENNNHMVVKKKNLWRADFDYIDKLSEEERRWLNKFVKEYYDGDMKPWAGIKRPLNRNKKLRKECWENNKSHSVNIDTATVIVAAGSEDNVKHSIQEDRLVPKEPEPENLGKRRLLSLIDAISAALKKP